MTTNEQRQQAAADYAAVVQLCEDATPTSLSPTYGASFAVTEPYREAARRLLGQVEAGDESAVPALADLLAAAQVRLAGVNAGQVASREVATAAGEVGGEVAKWAAMGLTLPIVLGAAFLVYMAFGRR